MYSYEAQKPNIFTEEGQVMFLKIRDRVHHLLDYAGACGFCQATDKVTGDVWDMMACLDRMIELGEICEITGPDAWGQRRVFVKGKKLI